jgi:tellurite methyltransferase
VLSWNVIHHGTLGNVGRRLAEIWRVLKPKALYQGTMLPMRNINYGRGRTVAPDTFVRDRAEERGHPHFYCDAATLVALYGGFEAAAAAQARLVALAHHRRAPAGVEAQRCHIGNTIGV